MKFKPKWLLLVAGVVLVNLALVYTAYVWADNPAGFYLGIPGFTLILSFLFIQVEDS